MDERLAKVKAYVKDHAPDIITASCSVTMTVLAVTAFNMHVKNTKIAQQAIHVLKKDGRDFSFYPGVGIYVETTAE